MTVHGPQLKRGLSGRSKARTHAADYKVHEDADPELHPVVQDVRQRLARLAKEH